MRRIQKIRGFTYRAQCAAEGHSNEDWWVSIERQIFNQIRQPNDVQVARAIARAVLELGT